MKYRLCIIILLTLVWIVLGEALSWVTVTLGLAVSIGCVYACAKFLPFESVSNLRLWRLILYPFFLVGQIYLSGFYVIKVILTGSKVEVSTAKTEIDSDFLRVLLGNSITLTPGSILLELQKDELMILWLQPRRGRPSGEDTAKRLEAKLLSIQK